MKRKGRSNGDELRPEYDFDYSKAVRGKYYKRLLKEGANVVVLEPDVAKAFRDSATVNDALRSLLQVARLSRRPTARSARAARKRATA
ncbi:MAG: hypothetical protein HYV04_05865 [Deltaproteobacteria bacterium]|nr:hypothetical protein [Deltaproteobacteria bacterium]